MEADVTRNIEEQLSAFLDGELPEAELELLVRRLGRDENLRATLARYSAIGSVLRKDSVVASSKDFRSGVMRAISSNDNDADDSAVEPVIAATANRRFGSMLAAAVAVLAVVGIYQLDPLGNLTKAETDVELAGISPVQTGSDTFATLSGARARAANRERMTSYMVSHGEFSRSMQGAMVDSRIFVQQARFEQ
jgi:negative regulator of sigma E activity